MNDRAGIKEIDLRLPPKMTRQRIRELVVMKFLEEEPGTGKGELSARYRYFVETLADGKRIYLKRPAILNNGFDFTIEVENMVFQSKSGRRSSRPSHKNILDDLRAKKLEDPEEYRKLYAVIRQVWECSAVGVDDYRDLQLGIGYPVDLVIGVLKWMFIEQDVTYWSFSGRGMLLGGIPTPE